MKPYLLEVNTNPAIFLDTKVQKEVIPPVVEATIEVATKLWREPGKVKEVVEEVGKVFEVIY